MKPNSPRPLRATLTTVGVVVASSALVLSGTAPASASDDNPAGSPSLSNAANKHTKSDEPTIIAHRGASGYRPEHTLAAYKLAIQMGADYIEPDLVSTSDGALIARHENEIGTTTDVADHPEFANRKRSKTIDGLTVSGWFTEDFTLKEIKTLRAKERLPQVRPSNTRYDGRYEIPTLDEVIDLAQKESRKRDAKIGVAPETKHPTYFQGIGLALEGPLVKTLKRQKLDKPGSPVVIQSFETANLKYLATKTPVNLAQLIDATGAPYDLVAAGDDRTYADLVTRQGLRQIAKYADTVGTNKNVLIPRDADQFLTEPTGVVKLAHRAGLEVFAWTFRDENQFLPADFRDGTDPNTKGDVFAEYDAFFDLGIDGVFADQPDSAIEARDSR